MICSKTSDTKRKPSSKLLVMSSLLAQLRYTMKSRIMNPYRSLSRTTSVLCMTFSACLTEICGGNGTSKLLRHRLSNGAVAIPSADRLNARRRVLVKTVNSPFDELKGRVFEEVLRSISIAKICEKRRKTTKQYHPVFTTIVFEWMLMKIVTQTWGFIYS